MIAVTIAAVGLAWVRFSVDRYVSEWRSEQEVLQHMHVSGFSIRNIKPAYAVAPAWWIDEPIYERVVEIGLTAEPSDDDMQALASFSHLEHVYSWMPWSPGPTEAGCAHLAQCSSLKSVRLEGMELSDGCVRPLADLPHLEDLCLSYGILTDASLESIGRMKSLRQLRVEGDLSDKGLEQLSGFTQLQRLSLYGGFEGTGLAALRAPGLEYLHVEQDISDRGLVAIGKFKGLHRLTVKGPEITDSGLAELTRLEGLEYLYVDSDQVTVEGMLQLKRLPKLHTIGAPDAWSEVDAERLADAWPEMTVEHWGNFVRTSKQK